MLGMPAGPARSPAKPLDAKSRERLAEALTIYRAALDVA
jgi:4-hydroxy-tetrahydrodipicolinate synthase